MTDQAPAAPMEALLADELPAGEGWQYEPKWDGFRCLVERNSRGVRLWSKSGKPLGRYFPEVVTMFAGLPRSSFVIDGELVIVTNDRLSFDALQMRLHPAESRIRKLAAETPATFIAFDLLKVGRQSLSGKSLADRRAALEALLADVDQASLSLSPATRDRAVALGWLARSGGALDGVIAKRLDQSYRAGERAMVKVKPRRTADCVVGGFRTASGSDEVGSLLLGLFNARGELDHVGFTSALKQQDRPELTRRLRRLAGGSGFTGRAPGGPSRWATDRSAEWVPLKPELVVEVRYDQVTDDRFRHGTGFVRWRPDKAPRQCTVDQLAPPLKPSQLAELFG